MQLTTGESTAPLLQIEPDLGEFLLPDDRAALERLRVPVRSVFSTELEIDRLLFQSEAFALVVVEGVLAHEMAVSGQPGMTLLGAGDIVARSGAAGSTLVRTSRYSTAGALRFALLGDRVLAAAQRFPRLITGLQVRIGDQHQRLAAQLLICQLPRVEDRLLTMMWLLAERWGRVTPSGTSLPLRLTHETLGALVGARRPTVSLALKQLTAEGAMIHQPHGWLLVRAPDLAAPPGPMLAQPNIALEAAVSPWAVAEIANVDDRPHHLHETLQELRARHMIDVERVQDRLQRSRESRRRSRVLLARAARNRLRAARLHHDDDAGDLAVGPDGEG